MVSRWSRVAAAAVAALLVVLATPPARALPPTGRTADLAPREVDYDPDLRDELELVRDQQADAEAAYAELVPAAAAAEAALAEARDQLDRADRRLAIERATLAARVADREEATAVAARAAAAAERADGRERTERGALRDLERELAAASELLHERVVAVHKRGAVATYRRLVLLDAARGAESLAEVAWVDRALQDQAGDAAVVVTELTAAVVLQTERYEVARAVAERAREEADWTAAARRRAEDAEAEQAARVATARSARDGAAAVVATREDEAERAVRALAAVRADLVRLADRLEAIAREQAGRAVWPTAGRVSSGFGARPDPFTGERSFHSGLDVAAPTGTPVVAMWTGRVVRTGPRGGYGLTVELDHGEGITTRYAHLSRIDVAVGTVVRRGERLGAVGSTGRSTGPHLHLEVRVGGVARDPRPLLP
jgi:murein DD-endopeptidase MepM/ murein hydrolase activator NlpD